MKEEIETGKSCKIPLGPNTSFGNEASKGIVLRNFNA